MRESSSEKFVAAEEGEAEEYNVEGNL